MNANELLQYLTPTAAKGTTFFLLAGPCVIEGEKWHSTLPKRY